MHTSFSGPFSKKQDQYPHQKQKNPVKRQANKRVGTASAGTSRAFRKIKAIIDSTKIPMRNLSSIKYFEVEREIMHLYKKIRSSNT